MNRMRVLLIVAMPVLMGQMCATSADQQSGTQDTSQDQTAADGSGSGDTTTPQATTLTGSGFSVVIPAGYTLDPTFASLVSTSSLKAYIGQDKLIVVSTQTPAAGGPYNFNCSELHIQDGRSTDSGDSLLVAKVSVYPSDAAKLVAYGLLANGDLLAVEICPGRALTAEDQTFGTTVFASIKLDNTDGQALQQKLQAQAPKMLLRTGENLIILDDLSAWALDPSASDEATTEMQSWTSGTAVHTQTAGDEFELMRVGKWLAVPVRSLQSATSTRIASYDQDFHNLTFTNAWSRHLSYKLPSYFRSGESVYIVKDGLKMWLIEPNNWLAIEM